MSKRLRHDQECRELRSRLEDGRHITPSFAAAMFQTDAMSEFLDRQTWESEGSICCGQNGVVYCADSDLTTLEGDPTHLIGISKKTYDVEPVGSLLHGDEGSFGVLRLGRCHEAEKEGKVVVKELRLKPQPGFRRTGQRLLRMEYGGPARQTALASNPEVLLEGKTFFNNDDPTLISASDVWLLAGSNSTVIAAYRRNAEDSFRELTLPMCVSVWGMGNSAIGGMGCEAFSHPSQIPMPTNFSRFLQQRLVLMSEIRAMRDIPHHKNVIRLLDVVELLFDSHERLFAILPLAEHGDLMDFVQKNLPSEKQARMLFTQVVRGLEAVHAAGYSHRDLKLDNCFVSENQGELVVWVGDFGLATRVQVDTSENQVGSQLIRAPELFGEGSRASVSCSSSSSSYDPKAADLWSLGIVLFNLLSHSDVWWAGNGGACGSSVSQVESGAVAQSPSCCRCSAVPMREASIRDAGFRMFAEKKHMFPAHFDPMACDLIENLLKLDPTQRISLSQVLQHPWMNLNGADPNVVSCSVNKKF